MKNKIFNGSSIGSYLTFFFWNSINIIIEILQVRNYKYQLLRSLHEYWARNGRKPNTVELWNCKRKIYILQPLTSRFITFVRILIYLFVVFLFKETFQTNEVLSYSIYCTYIHVIYRTRNLYYIVEFFRWCHFVI